MRWRLQRYFGLERYGFIVGFGEAIVWLLFIDEPLDFMCSFFIDDELFIDELFVECIAPALGFGEALLI